MTLSEQECTQKWEQISDSLDNLDKVVNELVKQAEMVPEMERTEVARLHATVAYIATNIENIKLRMSLENAQLKDHPIEVQLAHVDKYLRKAKRGIKEEAPEATASK